MTAAVNGVFPPGEKAPSFDLPGPDGGAISLPVRAAAGLTLVMFYKSSCPTCRLTVPFLQRLHEQVGPGGGRVVAVSQDGPDGAASFALEFGLTMPVAVDGPGWPVSRRYDLVSVPTIYLLKADGTVVRSLTGFHKEALQQMANDLAASVGAAPQALYRDGESPPEFKPG